MTFCVSVFVPCGSQWAVKGLGAVISDWENIQTDMDTYNVSYNTDQHFWLLFPKLINKNLLCKEHWRAVDC